MNKVNKSILYVVCCLLQTFMLYSCSDGDTYADQKERERQAVLAFVERTNVIVDGEGDTLCNVGKINPISEVLFAQQGDSTSVEKNEYVLFKNSGIYLQIVRKGNGKPIADGESKSVVCQYFEYNIMGDSLQSRSETNYWAPAPDVMSVTNNSGSIIGTFDDKNFPAGPMRTYYGESVPSGWLVPLKYVGLGRQMRPDQGIAKVRIVVPHSQGHSTAMGQVYACFYEIKFQEVANQ